MTFTTTEQFEEDIKKLFPSENLTPKEKVAKLFQGFLRLSGEENARKAVIITAKHAIKQSAKFGGYSGYKLDFWQSALVEAEKL